MPDYDACLIDAELRARAAYAEPGRRYHDRRHLDDCLTKLEGVADLSERERRLLHWAILWHDAVYDPRRQDNEERSAELAAKELSACGVDPSDAAEVSRLILLTKGHKPEPGDSLGALLVSIDLSILGSPSDEYEAYAQAVREEYAHVPDDAWQVGRAAVLRSLLAAGPLYADERFRGALEAQARDNMEAELRSLSAG